MSVKSLKCNSISLLFCERGLNQLVFVPAPFSFWNLNEQNNFFIQRRKETLKFGTLFLCLDTTTWRTIEDAMV